ncbi:MAG: site-specific integrase [Anaerolineales bacterium]
MAKRKLKRANQEGSAFQLKNGSWRAQITLDGKRLSFSALSQGECRDWIRKMLNKVDAGLTYEVMQITLAEYLHDWLANAKTTIRFTTFEQYQQITRDYIKPLLGNVKVFELRPEHVQHLYATHLQNGASARTVRMVHCVVHRSLNQAVQMGLIDRNPASFVKPPRLKRKEMKFYDEGQVQALLITAEAAQDRYLALWKVAVTTGMRMGELLGLKWVDLDWSKGYLQVRRQLKVTRGGGFHFAEPKSKAGLRAIVLGLDTLSLLKVHQDQLHQERVQLGDRWKEQDLIFPSSVGTPTRPGKILVRFKRLIKLAGLPEIRFHDLRHTAASLMLNNGIPLIVVSRRLGHAQPSITLNVYGHMIPMMQEQAAELMDKITAPISIQFPS